MMEVHVRERSRGRNVVLAFWESDGALGFGAQPSLPLLVPGGSEFFLPNGLGLSILFCHACTHGLADPGLGEFRVLMEIITFSLWLAVQAPGNRPGSQGTSPPLFLALIYVYSDHISLSPVSAVGHRLS